MLPIEKIRARQEKVSKKDARADVPAKVRASIKKQRPVDIIKSRSGDTKAKQEANRKAASTRAIGQGRVGKPKLVANGLVLITEIDARRFNAQVSRVDLQRKAPTRIVKEGKYAGKHVLDYKYLKSIQVKKIRFEMCAIKDIKKSEFYAPGEKGAEIAKERMKAKALSQATKVAKAKVATEMKEKAKERNLEKKKAANAEKAKLREKLEAEAEKEIPAMVEDLTQKAIQKSRDERYVTKAELKKELINMKGIGEKTANIILMSFGNKIGLVKDLASGRVAEFLDEDVVEILTARYIRFEAVEMDKGVEAPDPAINVPVVDPKKEEDKKSKDDSKK